MSDLKDKLVFNRDRELKRYVDEFVINLKTRLEKASEEGWSIVTTDLMKNQEDYKKYARFYLHPDFLKLVSKHFKGLTITLHHVFSNNITGHEFNERQSVFDTEKLILKVDWT